MLTELLNQVSAAVEEELSVNVPLIPVETVDCSSGACIHQAEKKHREEEWKSEHFKWMGRN